MKKILSVFALILFISLQSREVKAQNEFAPVGAEWFHDMSTGDLIFHYKGDKIYHSQVLRDTVIDGIQCRQIFIKPYFDYSIIKDDEYKADNLDALNSVLKYEYFVYNNADTVFFYNKIFEKFTPLYIFNVEAGDTVQIPIVPGLACEGTMDSGYFTIIIDSVKMVDWGGALLKTVYNHTLIDTNINSGRFDAHYRYGNDYFSNSGVYVEKLGSPNSGFLPLCFGCLDAVTGAEKPECQMPIALRCYSEPSGAISVNMVDSSCDFGLLVKASISKTTKSFSNVEIYPNPVSHTLNLANLPIGVDIAVFDVMGRKIFSSSVQQSNFKINTESWAQGVYLVQLNYQGERWMEKVVK